MQLLLAKYQLYNYIGVSRDAGNYNLAGLPVVLEIKLSAVPNPKEAVRAFRID